MFLQCNLIQHKTRFSNLFSLQRHSLTHYITSFLSHVVTDITVYYHSYQHNTHTAQHWKLAAYYWERNAIEKKVLLNFIELHLKCMYASHSMQVYRLVLDSYLCTFCCCCVWEKREGKLFHVISMLLLLFYYIVLHYTIKTHTTWLWVSFEHYRITAHETWWSTDFFSLFMHYTRMISMRYVIIHVYCLSVVAYSDKILALAPVFFSCMSDKKQVQV